MRRTTLLGVAAACSMIVAGCGSMAHSRANIECPAMGECPIDVVVNTGTTPCTIDDPGDIHVGKGKKPILKWIITTPGYKFSTDGITFKDPQPPSGVFQVVGPNGSVFRIRDNNNQMPSGPSKYPQRYKITVQKDNAFACSLDPTILNDGCDPSDPNCP